MHPLVSYNANNLRQIMSQIQVMLTEFHVAKSQNDIISVNFVVYERKAE